MFSSSILLMPRMVSTPSSSLLSLVRHRKSVREARSAWRSSKCNSTHKKHAEREADNQHGHGLEERMKPRHCLAVETCDSSLKFLQPRPDFP